MPSLPQEIVVSLLSELLHLRRDLIVQDIGELLQLGSLLCNGLSRVIFHVVVQTGTSGLLNHADELFWPQIDDLGDLSLLDQEVGVINVEVDTFENVLDLGVGDLGSVEEVLGCDVDTTGEDL